MLGRHGLVRVTGFAEPAPLARERDEEIERAARTAHALEPVGQVSAGERGAPLALDVGRQCAAAVFIDKTREERLAVPAQHAVDDAPRRVAPHDVGRVRKVLAQSELAPSIFVGGALRSPNPRSFPRLQPERDRGDGRAVSHAPVESLGAVRPVPL